MLAKTHQSMLSMAFLFPYRFFLLDKRAIATLNPQCKAYLFSEPMLTYSIYPSVRITDV